MDVCKLSEKKCRSCNHQTPSLSDSDIDRYLLMVTGWSTVAVLFNISRRTKIEKSFHFDNFAMAMAFINKIANVAEEEGHHPDFHLHNYRFVQVTLTTHAIKGLSENDFIMAAKIDTLVK